MFYRHFLPLPSVIMPIDWALIRSSVQFDQQPCWAAVQTCPNYSRAAFYCISGCPTSPFARTSPTTVKSEMEAAKRNGIDPKLIGKSSPNEAHYIIGNDDDDDDGIGADGDNDAWKVLWRQRPSTLPCSVWGENVLHERCPRLCVPSATIWNNVYRWTLFLHMDNKRHYLIWLSNQ